MLGRGFWRANALAVAVWHSFRQRSAAWRSRFRRAGVHMRQFWQCPKPARPGFPVCGFHGAGFEKREREGLRQNPRLASLKSGRDMSPNTFTYIVERNPGLRVLFQQTEQGVVEWRRELAALKVLVQYRLDEQPLKTAEDISSLAKLIERTVRVAEKVATIERRGDVVTEADLERASRAITSVIQLFVPLEQRHVAIDH